MTTFTQFLHAVQRHATVTHTAERADGGQLAQLSLTVNNRPYFSSDVTVHEDGTASGTLRLGTVAKRTVSEDSLRRKLTEYAAPLNSYTLRLELTGDIQDDPPEDPSSYWYPHIEFDDVEPLRVVDVVYELEASPPFP